MKTIIVILVTALFASALQLVIVRHKNRLLFMELQTLQQQRDALNIEWGQLQLEQSTWAQHSYIENIARKQLGMTVPSPEQIVVIRP